MIGLTVTPVLPEKATLADLSVRSAGLQKLYARKSTLPAEVKAAEQAVREAVAKLEQAKTTLTDLKALKLIGRAKPSDMAAAFEAVEKAEELVATTQDDLSTLAAASERLDEAIQQERALRVQEILPAARVLALAQLRKMQAALQHLAEITAEGQQLALALEDGLEQQHITISGGADVGCTSLDKRFSAGVPFILTAMSYYRRNEQAKRVIEKHQTLLRDSIAAIQKAEQQAQ